MSMLSIFSLILPLLFVGWIFHRCFGQRDLFVIKLIRHGQSMENAGLVHSKDVGDQAIELTATGHDQARARGAAIGKKALTDAFIFLSPYRRTVDTLIGILRGAGFTDAEIAAMKLHQDPLLREMEAGYAPLAEQVEKRRLHRYFYYRFDGGESPADVYDRISGFIDSLWRFMKKERSAFYFPFFGKRTPRTVYIVGHGLAHRIFVMRWLHLTVDEFDRLENPDNCDEITIAPAKWLDKPQIVRGRWGVQGLRFRL